MYAPTSCGAELLVVAEEREEEVADHLLRVDRPVLLREGLQRRARARSADDPEVAVHLVGRRQLLDVRRVVGVRRGCEDALRDLAAPCTELGDEAGARRVAEAVVVHEDRRFAPTETLVGKLTCTGVPLSAVAVVAEEVLRPDLERRLLTARGAVQEGLLRMRLRVVRDGDTLVTGERADHDLASELLHQAPCLLERQRRRLVAAAVADDLDRSCRPAIRR